MSAPNVAVSPYFLQNDQKLERREDTKSGWFYPSLNVKGATARVQEEVADYLEHLRRLAGYMS